MYLITYQQWTGSMTITANAVIKMHPIDWLIGSEKKFPKANTTLINWWEVTEDQFKRLGEHF